MIRSGFVSLRSDLLPEPALEPPPTPPTPGPFAADGSCLIYMWESCDGAPALASFVLLRAPSPAPPSSRLRQQERQQFYRSRKLVGEMKRLQSVHVSVIICGLLQTHLTPQTPKCWRQVQPGGSERRPAVAVHVGTPARNWERCVRSITDRFQLPGATSPLKRNKSKKSR